jgi:hypothetical protein
MQALPQYDYIFAIAMLFAFLVRKQYCPCIVVQYLNIDRMLIALAPTTSQIPLQLQSLLGL